MDDEMLDCPVNVEYYCGTPSVWCDMPTGKSLLGLFRD